MRTQYWLVSLDQYGNPTLRDGSHHDEAGANEALYLYRSLGLAKEGERFAVAKIELTEAVPDGSSVNHEAVASLNAIGLRPTE